MGKPSFRRPFAFGFSLVNRWKTSPEKDFASKLEFLGRFKTGIHPSRILQPLELLRLIEREALRLANNPIRSDAEPVEIVAESPGRTLGSIAPDRAVVNSPEETRPRFFERTGNCGAQSEYCRREGGPSAKAQNA